MISAHILNKQNTPHIHPQTNSRFKKHKHHPPRKLQVVQMSSSSLSTRDLRDDEHKAMDDTDLNTRHNIKSTAYTTTPRDRDGPVSSSKNIQQQQQQPQQQKHPNISISTITSQMDDDEKQNIILHRLDKINDQQQQQYKQQQRALQQPDGSIIPIEEGAWDYNTKVSDEYKNTVLYYHNRSLEDQMGSITADYVDRPLFILPSSQRALLWDVSPTTPTKTVAGVDETKTDLVQRYESTLSKQPPTPKAPVTTTKHFLENSNDLRYNEQLLQSLHYLQNVLPELLPTQFTAPLRGELQDMSVLDNNYDHSIESSCYTYTLPSYTQIMRTRLSGDLCPTVPSNDLLNTIVAAISPKNQQSLTTPHEEFINDTNTRLLTFHPSNLNVDLAKTTFPDINSTLLTISPKGLNAYYDEYDHYAQHPQDIPQEYLQPNNNVYYNPNTNQSQNIKNAPILRFKHHRPQNISISDDQLNVEHKYQTFQQQVTTTKTIVHDNETNKNDVKVKQTVQNVLNTTDKNVPSSSLLRDNDNNNQVHVKREVTKDTTPKSFIWKLPIVSWFAPADTPTTTTTTQQTTRTRTVVEPVDVISTKRTSSQPLASSKQQKSYDESDLNTDFSTTAYVDNLNNLQTNLHKSLLNDIYTTRRSGLFTTQIPKNCAIYNYPYTTNLSRPSPQHEASSLLTLHPADQSVSPPTILLTTPNGEIMRIALDHPNVQKLPQNVIDQIHNQIGIEINRNLHNILYANVPFANSIDNTHYSSLLMADDIIASAMDGVIGNVKDVFSTWNDKKVDELKTDLKNYQQHLNHTIKLKEDEVNRAYVEKQRVLNAALQDYTAQRDEALKRQHFAQKEHQRLFDTQQKEIKHDEDLCLKELHVVTEQLKQMRLERDDLVNNIKRNVDPNFNLNKDSISKPLEQIYSRDWLITTFNHNNTNIEDLLKQKQHDLQHKLQQLEQEKEKLIKSFYHDNDTLQQRYNTELSSFNSTLEQLKQQKQRAENDFKNAYNQALNALNEYKVKNDPSHNLQEISLIQKDIQSKQHELDTIHTTYDNELKHYEDMLKQLENNISLTSSQRETEILKLNDQIAQLYDQYDANARSTQQQINQWTDALTHQQKALEQFDYDYSRTIAKLESDLANLELELCFEQPPMVVQEVIKVPEVIRVTERVVVKEPIHHLEKQYKIIDDAFERELQQQTSTTTSSTSTTRNNVQHVATDSKLDVRRAADDLANDVRRTADDVALDVRRVTEDVKRATKDATREVKLTTENVTHDVNNVARNVVNDVSDTFENVKDDFTRAGKQIKRDVKRAVNDVENIVDNKQDNASYHFNHHLFDNQWHALETDDESASGGFSENELTDDEN